MSQISQKKALTITNLVFGVLGVGFVVLLVLFIIKLAKGKDNKSSSPTSHPTGGPTRGPTLGPSRPTSGPNQILAFYNTNTHEKLSDDNACYTCKNKSNVCGCYANNNCSISPDKFEIPPVCGSMPCMQYETQDENGGSSVCNQNGIDLFKSVVNDSYICGSSNQSNNKQSCLRQCEQHDYPFNGLPPCMSCCKEACDNQNCPTSGGGTPIRTFAPIPSGNIISCSECDTLYNEMGDSGMRNILGFGYSECKAKCSNK